MAVVTSQIGFFGKLPAYPDFVRQNAGGPLARALDNWIHEGVAQMNVQGGSDWQARFDAASPKNFVYHTDDPSKLLVGVFAPSRDKSGRRYPFSLFANASPGKNGRHVHLIPEAYSVFLKATARLLNNLDTVAAELRSGKVSGFATTLPQNLFEYDRRFSRLLELQKTADFWSETIGDFSNPAKYLVMKNLLSTLVPLRGKDLRKFELCLALPLSAYPAAQGFQITIWLMLCRGVLKHLVNSMVAFWDARQDEKPARLYLFFRSPGPRYLSSLVDPQSAGDLIWDMATLGAEKIGDAKTKLPADLVSLLDNGELPIGSFLEALAR